VKDRHVPAIFAAGPLVSLGAFVSYLFFGTQPQPFIRISRTATRRALALGTVYPALTLIEKTYATPPNRPYLVGEKARPHASDWTREREKFQKSKNTPNNPMRPYKWRK
jgi:hypothetical protein